ncbi:cysteine methyltransferase [Sporosarcina sp. P16b]|nr:cysteine methyltransferase [Sporosarcina sp. P16b]
MIYWTNFDFNEWIVTIAATKQGLCYAGLAEDSVERMKDWSYRFDTVDLIEDETKLGVYISKMKEYLSGTTKDFSVIPLDLKGTSFQLQVWEALQRIPYGETMTYSEIAEQIGKSSSVRAVASAIGKNPVMVVVPCHRVIAKDGSLSGYRDGRNQKAKLILLESTHTKINE